jgi:hypothetical protein
MVMTRKNRHPELGSGQWAASALEVKEPSS